MDLNAAVANFVGDGGWRNPCNFSAETW